MMLSSDADVMLIGGAAGGGKALRHGEKVLTPTGFRNIEDMAVGDIITTPDNGTEKVTAVYPQGIVDIYRMTFQDGSQIDCSGEHLWRITKAGSKFKEKEVTTLDIDEILKVESKKNGRKYWPLIRLAEELDIKKDNECDLPLHPYVVGFLLGDGGLTQQAVFCSEDQEIVDRITDLGYEVHKVKDSKGGITYIIQKIKSTLADIGLLGKKSESKIIPKQYMYSSIEDRYELLRGLFDADGYVAKGKYGAYYYSVSKVMANQVSYLIRSLGGTATIISDYGKYRLPDGTIKVCQKVYNVYIRHRDISKLFYLPRKKNRNPRKYNDKLKNRIKSVEYVGKDYASCISISGEDKLYITTNFIVTHNSHILTMINLRYLDDPLFRGIMYRRTFSQLSKAGNISDKCKQIFGLLPEDMRPKVLAGGTKFVWKHGSEIELTHMQFEKDKENIQGAELTLQLVDEACQFEWSQIEYMMSRMRSPSKYNSRLVMSANPDPDHYLRTVIDWWIDDDGYPIPEREGVLRYFIRIDGVFIWADTEKELHDKYDDIGPDGEVESCDPMSFTFISSTIRDNPIGMKANPRYLASLKALNPVDKARLLFGNWDIRASGANYFQREWINKLDSMPKLRSRCRSWDKASSQPSDSYRNPDYTASIGMGKTDDGDIVIYGNYCSENYDEDSETYGRFRKRPGERERIILAQAEYDGKNTEIILPMDPGSGGKSEYLQSSKNLMEYGFIVRKDPAPSSQAKLKRFEPFSAACQNGLVYIVESTFDRKTLDAIYKELEGFDGERSKGVKHDDWADCCATGFNYISQKKNVRIVRRQQSTHKTLSNSLLHKL